MTITGSSSVITATTRQPRLQSPASMIRVDPVEVPADGPTTKADCLNHLYDALIAYEVDKGRAAKAIVLHDAEDVVHPFELRIFDGLIDRAAVVQLPVLPLVDPQPRAGSAAIIATSSPRHTSRNWSCARPSARPFPLAGVGCAIARGALARLAALQDGKPFAGASMTEDYELGPAPRRARPQDDVRSAFPPSPASRASLPAAATSRLRSAPPSARRRAGWAASRLPAGTGSAGGAAWASAGCGCATGAVRSPPCCSSRATPRLLCGRSSGSPKRSGRRSRRAWARPHPASDGQRLAARLAGADARLLHRIRIRLARRRAVHPAAGRRQRRRDARRGARVSIHFGGGAKRWDKTRHVFPAELPQ